MNSVSDPDTPSIFEVLQDQSRFEIFLHLLVYKKLTLKELAKYLNKSKTTIFHHIRILERIVEWEEKEEGRRLKTKYFSLNYNKLKNELDQRALMKIEGLLSTNVMNRLITLSEEQPQFIHSSTFNKSYVKTFSITEENRHIYEEFETKMLEMAEKLETDVSSSDEKYPVTHIYAHVSVPIKELLEWNQKSQED